MTDRPNVNLVTGEVGGETRQALLDLARNRLGLYARDLPAAAFDDLIANQQDWGVGYDYINFCYWVTPCTAGGECLTPPLGVLKWDSAEFEALKTKLPGAAA